MTFRSWRPLARGLSVTVGIGLTAVAVEALASTAAAAPAELCDEDSTGLIRTDWGPLPLRLLRFDPSLGTLTSATLALTVLSQHTGSVESLDNAPRSVTTFAAVTVSLDAADLPVSEAVTVQSDSGPIELSEFDGVIDFGGTSGSSAFEGSASDRKAETLTSPELLGAVSGAGTIEFSAVARATSGARGPANMATLVTTDGAAAVEICYQYEPVPPATTTTTTTVPATTTTAPAPTTTAPATTTTAPAPTTTAPATTTTAPAPTTTAPTTTLPTTTTTGPTTSVGSTTTVAMPGTGQDSGGRVALAVALAGIGTLALLLARRPEVDDRDGAPSARTTRQG